MKLLYLLRHAQADNAFDKKDAERPLTEHGYTQAKKIALHLKDIDMALCSSAVRTRETFETMIQHGETPNKIKFTHDLYNAPADRIFQEISDVNADNLLIVAHNPGIHLIAHELVKPNQSMEYINLSLSYPPCSLTVMRCDIKDWGLLSKKQNELINFITL